MESAIVKSIENIITFNFFFKHWSPRGHTECFNCQSMRDYDNMGKNHLIASSKDDLSFLITIRLAWLTPWIDCRLLFFSFCHKWFFPQFSNLHIRLIKLAKNHFSYQLKITYYLRNTCCFVHKIDFNSSMIHRHLLKRSLFFIILWKIYKILNLENYQKNKIMEGFEQVEK